MTEAQLYRRDASVIAAVLAVILAIVFAPFLFGNKTLMASAGDVPSVYVEGASVGHFTGHYRGLDQGASGWQTEPAFAATHRIMFDEHRLPFWEPDGAYGKPWAGAMVPQPFYPPSTIVALHPSPRMEAWWVVTRLFIAGLFAALFVRLFFTSLTAALSAGIAGMFAGYFLLYYDMPHLSVEVEVPMLLWAVELLSRKISARRIAALAGTVALVILGGMPESAVLALLISGVYALARLTTLPGARKARIVALAGGYAVGIGMGSIELVPFVELLMRGASDHDPAMRQGLGYDPAWHSGFLTELFPRAFGSPYESVMTNGFGFSGTRGFFGMAGCMLAASAIASAWLKRDGRTAIVTLLALVVCYFELKRFGNPLLNWTGGLPVLVQIQFAKYGEAEVAALVAILVGFGVGFVLERRETRSLWIGSFATLTIASVVYLATRNTLPATPAAAIYPHAITLGLLFLFAAVIAIMIAVTQHGRVQIAASALLLAVLVAEPFVTYLYPVLFRYAPAITQNPYAGAPYIAFLQNHMHPSNERLMGINAMLFPNWAAAFDLNDVRSIEAVTLSNYLPFVDAFVATAPAASDDQFDRFVSTKPIDMNRSLVQRWLALSSVGYILSPTYDDMIAEPPGSILGTIVDQATQELPPGGQAAAHEEAVRIAGQGEATFFEHPPQDLTFRLPVDRSATRFVADAALKPASYSPVVLCGGAVTFSMRASLHGTEIATATRTIDPKHVMADRRWLPIGLDLTRAAGETVDLHLQTSAVDTCAAWAVWGEPRFIALNAPVSFVHNRLIYPVVYREPGINIFRASNSLGRMTLYHEAETAGSFAEAIDALRRPSFDIHRDAVVEGPIPHLSRANGRDRVTITSIRSDRVEATVNAGSDALLMQNDSWYPGWKATVDGSAVPIVKTDAFFRGIPMPAGSHHVVIAYDSFTALTGTLLSIFGTLLFALLLIDPIALSRRRTAAE